MGALGGELTIDLGAVQRNYKILRNKVGTNCTVAPSVKANAYGLGVAQVVPALYDAGARSFFVATIDEGLELRVLLPDIEIYILNGFFEPARDVYQKYNLTPVLNSLHDIKTYGQDAAILHFDTGMNRLGIPAGESEMITSDLSILDDIDLRCVMSHFVSSEESHNSMNADQFLRFQTIMTHFPDAKFSMCNSGGMFLSSDYHLDMVRPGIALYGGHPSDSVDVNPMSPVVSLNVPVLQIHSVKSGETVGYNSTHRFHKKSNVAVMSIGYADGLFRAISNEGALYWKDYTLPIRGRVSMDLVICDISEIPEGEYPKIGDLVEVIGVHQTIDDLARSAGTISYEILTALGARYKRIYV